MPPVRLLGALASSLGKQADEFGSTELEKEAWVSEVLLEWGSCGRIVLHAAACRPAT